jgi:DNA-directed RNA polymerase subunit RPC12/RpoP
MSITFLTHVECGGNVVLDATKTTKLIAPSFAINSGGISNLTLDIHVMDGGVMEPVFFCVTCNKEILKENISVELRAGCQICGGVFKVESLFVHSEISCLCQFCRTKLDTYAQNGGECEEVIRDYSEQFGITKKMKVVPLVKVLSSPITI